MKHKHAQLMAQYAQDAMETDKPWERWEWYNTSSGKWCNFGNSVAFFEDFEYRRKPRTININGFEVPEPERKPLWRDAVYWVPCLGSKTDRVRMVYWGGDNFDKSVLSRGLVHLTYEAAEIHAKALLSFTEKTPL